MSLSIVIDRTANLAIYQQIAGQIREEIGSGRLPPGSRLPTVRQMAEQLSVTRLTVQNAYTELQSHGWVESTVGRGTFVGKDIQLAPHLAAAGQPLTPAAVIGDILHFGQAPGVRSLAHASPDLSLFPADEFWAHLANLRAVADTVVGYGPTQGDAMLRLALAEMLRDRDITATPGEILVTAGVTQALALVAQALAQPGDVVLVEQPTYIGFLHQLRTYGLQPMAVPLDAEGPRLDVLERLALQLRPRFFYTVPSYHNPTGLCMSLERRQHLLALAAKHGFLLVEDDIYAPLAYATPAPPPLKALDRAGVVIYATSLSKTLAPGLRLGCLVAPPAWQERFVPLRLAADLGSSLLLQRTLAHFLQEGGLRRHLRRVLPVYGARRDAMVQALEAHMPSGVTWTQPAGGFSCWLTLPRQPQLVDLRRLMLQQGWAVAPGETFLVQPSAHLHLRLSFGSLPPDAIRRGVQILGSLVRQQLSLPAEPYADGTDWMPLV